MRWKKSRVYYSRKRTTIKSLSSKQKKSQKKQVDEEQSIKEKMVVGAHSSACVGVRGADEEGSESVRSELGIVSLGRGLP